MIQVQLFIDEDDRYKGRSAHEQIMRLLMHQGIRGATSFAARAGYGKKHHLHHPGALGAVDEGPIMILFIDDDTKVRAVMPLIKEIVQDGLVVMHQVEQL